MNLENNKKITDLINHHLFQFEVKITNVIIRIRWYKRLLYVIKPKSLIDNITVEFKKLMNAEKIKKEGNNANVKKLFN